MESETFKERNVMDQYLRALSDAALKICEGNAAEAKSIITKGYPFKPIAKEKRSYSDLQQMEQFFRDGFVDRYFGTRLINPGMLRVFSELYPDAFPYQAHWKTDECHMAYWDYQPTIDHIVPIAQGGSNDPSNWATTSMKGNLAKRNFTLEQLHWHLHPAGNVAEWDGLSKDFICIVDQDTDLLKINAISRWYKATKEVLPRFIVE